MCQPELQQSVQEASLCATHRHHRRAVVDLKLRVVQVVHERAARRLVEAVVPADRRDPRVAQHEEQVQRVAADAEPRQQQRQQ